MQAGGGCQSPQSLSLLLYHRPGSGLPLRPPGGQAGEGVMGPDPGGSSACPSLFPLSGWASLTNTRPKYQAGFPDTGVSDLKSPRLPAPTHRESHQHPALSSRFRSIWPEECSPLGPEVMRQTAESHAWHTRQCSLAGCCCHWL